MAHKFLFLGLLALATWLLAFIAPEIRDAAVEAINSIKASLVPSGGTNDPVVPPRESTIADPDILNRFQLDPKGAANYETQPEAQPQPDPQCLVDASTALQWLRHNPTQAPEIIVQHMCVNPAQAPGIIAKAKEHLSQEASGDVSKLKPSGLRPATPSALIKMPSSSCPAFDRAVEDIVALDGEWGGGFGELVASASDLVSFADRVYPDGANDPGALKVFELVATDFRTRTHGVSTNLRTNDAAMAECNKIKRDSRRIIEDCKTRMSSAIQTGMQLMEKEEEKRIHTEKEKELKRIDENFIAE